MPDSGVCHPKYALTLPLSIFLQHILDVYKRQLIPPAVFPAAHKVPAAALTAFFVQPAPVLFLLIPQSEKISHGMLHLRNI